VYLRRPRTQCRLVVILVVVGSVVGDAARVDLTVIRPFRGGAVVGGPVAEVGRVGAERGAVVAVLRFPGEPGGIVHIRPVQPEPAIRVCLVAEETEPGSRVSACQSGKEVVGSPVMYGNGLSGGMEVVAFQGNFHPRHSEASGMVITYSLEIAPVVWALLIQGGGVLQCLNDRQEERQLDQLHRGL